VPGERRKNCGVPSLRSPGILLRELEKNGWLGALELPEIAAKGEKKIILGTTT